MSLSSVAGILDGYGGWHTVVAPRKSLRHHVRPGQLLLVGHPRTSSPKSFHSLFARIGERAKMPFPIHPHMLRHACGYALANAGHNTRAPQAYLGHKNIQHTVRYTELAPDRFKDFWR